MKKLPNKVDLRLQYPMIYDQGGLGSSTACALAIAIYNYKKIKFIYFNIKEI
jgi:hypothetical protein